MAMASRTLVIGLSVAVLATGSARAQEDVASRKFLEAAIARNNLEMKLGQLAEMRGSTPEVRAYGQLLARGHFPNPLAANRLAAQLHMLAPLRGSGEAHAERAELRAMAGPDFDGAFVRLLATRQAEDLTDFRGQAARGGAIADLAREAVPILERQLMTVRALERGVSGEPAGGS
jgi:putative membrane protein